MERLFSYCEHCKQTTEHSENKICFGCGKKKDINDIDVDFIKTFNNEKEMDLLK